MEFLRKLGQIALVGVVAALLASGCEKQEKKAPEEEPGAMTSPAAPAPRAEAPDYEDTVWIKVDGEEIMRSEVEKEMSEIKAQLSQQVPPEQMGQMGAMIKYGGMQTAVQKVLLENLAEKDRIKVSEAVVDEEFANLAERYPTPEIFQQQLAQMGMSEAELRGKIAEGLKYQKVLDEKVEVDEPTEEEIEEVYEQSKQFLKKPETAKAAYVYVGLTPGAQEQEKEKKLQLARDVAAEARASADFTELVKEHSEAPDADKGGVRTFQKGEIPGDFDEVVFAMEPGEVSDPIETPIGYYVVKLEDIEKESTASMEEVKEDITEYIKSEKEKEVMRDFLTGLVEGADVVYVEPLPPPPQMPGMPGGQAPPPAPEGGPAPEETMPPQ